MKKFIQLVRKNLLVLFRGKTAALLVLLGPMFIIFLLGIAFDNTNTYSLNIGLYTTTQTKTTDMFIDRLRERQFHVLPLQQEEQCPERIKDGSLHACIAFPEGFSLQEKGKNEISFYVDYGRVNLVYLILETLTNKVAAESKDISVNLTNVLLDKLESTRKEIFTKRPLLSAVGRRNREINERLTALSGEVQRLDTAMPASSVTGLLMLADGKSVDDGLTAVRTFVSVARGNVNDAERAAAAYTNPDGSNPVMEELRKVKGALKALEQAAASEFAPTKETLSKIKLGLGAVETQLTVVKEKLAAVAKVKTNADAAAKEMTQKTAETIADVQTLQGTFETIDQNIGSIQIRNAADIVNPVSTNIKAVNASGTHLNYLFPSLLALVIMFISLLLSTTLVVMEKNSPASFRNAIAPVSDASFISAAWITSILLVLTQVVIMIFLAGTIFSIPLYHALLPLSIGLLLSVALFSAIGMTIGYLFNSEETATIAAISLGTLLLFFSNAIIPLESMPPSLFRFVEYSPYLLSEAIIRKAAFYNLGFAAAAKEFLLLVAYVVFLLIFVFMLQTAIRRHLGYRWVHMQKQKILRFAKPVTEEPQAYIVPDEVGDLLEPQSTKRKKRTKKP
ncbi:ABC transporter permease [Candidatus Woesearchaeota archaeon]|nr:ABC transporter permease [Candidatus Woesearchaeota archaeon]